MLERHSSSFQPSWWCRDVFSGSYRILWGHLSILSFPLCFWTSTMFLLCVWWCVYFSIPWFLNWGIKVVHICTHCYIYLFLNYGHLIKKIFFKFIFIFGRFGSLLLCESFSLVLASGVYSLLWCVGFSLQWLLLLRSMGSRCAGSAVVAHRL